MNILFRDARVPDFFALSSEIWFNNCKDLSLSINPDPKNNHSIVQWGARGRPSPDSAAWQNSRANYELGDRVPMPIMPTDDGRLWQTLKHNLENSSSQFKNQMQSIIDWDRIRGTLTHQSCIKYDGRKSQQVLRQATIAAKSQSISRHPASECHPSAAGDQPHKWPATQSSKSPARPRSASKRQSSATAAQPSRSPARRHPRRDYRPH